MKETVLVFNGVVYHGPKKLLKRIQKENLGGKGLINPPLWVCNPKNPKWTHVYVG